MAKEAKNQSKTVKLKQFASSAGKIKRQIGTLVGLGLGRINSVSELEDTPSVRGMMKKVEHLVREVK
jgi:large subunit ribosomal protein L30